MAKEQAQAHKNVIIIDKMFFFIFLCENMVKCGLFLWSKLSFQHYYSSFQSHTILQKSL